MENTSQTNNRLLFVEHPFRPGVQVNLYPFFQKLEDFAEDCGDRREDSFASVDKFLGQHIKLVSVDMLAAAKDEMTSHEINTMFFGLYKLKEIFEGIQEIKT